MGSDVTKLQKMVQDDLDKLESSGLRYANKEKYDDLQKRYEALDKKLAVCNDSTPGGLYSLKWEYARISADFDFYFTFLNGINDIYNYKISEIKEAIENLLKRLNCDNYSDIEKELEDTVSYSQNISDHLVSSLEITNLINEIRYRIFKFKIDNQIIDDNFPVQDYTVLILKDISQIVDDPQVSITIREKLKKYIINPSKIAEDFQTIILLINLSSCEDVTEERIQYELHDRKYYHSKDFEIDFVQDDTIKLDGGLLFNSDSPQQRISNFSDMEYVNYIIKDLTELWKESRYHDIKDEILYLRKNNFSNWALLFKGFAEVDLFRCTYRFKELLNIFLDFHMNEPIDLLVCSLIPYLDKFHSEDDFDRLKEIALTTKSEYLMRFLFVHGHYSEEMIAFIIDSNNARLLEILNSVNDVELCKSCVDILIQKNLNFSKPMDRYFELSGMSEEEQKEYLIAKTNDAKKNESSLFLLGKLEEYGDAKSFIKIVKDTDDTTYLLLLSDNLHNEEIKSAVDDYIYGEIDKLNSSSYENKTVFYRLAVLSSNNRFSAYYDSKDLRSSNRWNVETVNDLISRFGQYRLDWNSILGFVYNRSTGELNSESLDIYCKYYEATLAKEGVTLEEKAEKLLSSGMGRGYLELIVYLSHKGLMVGNLISGYGNYNAFCYQSIYLKAIKNCKDKFNRISYYQRFVKKNNELQDRYNDKNIKRLEMDYDMLFLSNKELEEIKLGIDYGNVEEANAFDVRLRKYYWDLVRLLGEYQGQAIRKRIVMYIARSNYSEHIHYIATNHGEYLDLLMENVTDYRIQTDLMAIYNDSIASGRKS